MFLNIILIIIIVVSLSIILSIIFKKLPQLNRVDPEKVTEYQEETREEEIIEEKFKRDVEKYLTKVSKISILAISILRSSTNISIN